MTQPKFPVFARNNGALCALCDKRSELIMSKTTRNPVMSFMRSHQSSHLIAVQLNGIFDSAVWINIVKLSKQANYKRRFSVATGQVEIVVHLWEKLPNWLCQSRSILFICFQLIRIRKLRYHISCDPCSKLSEIGNGSAFVVFLNLLDGGFVCK